MTATKTAALETARLALTDSMIRAFRDEAIAAGDYAAKDTCNSALASDHDSDPNGSRCAVAKMIVDGHMSDDDSTHPVVVAYRDAIR